jgi:hypothetical protein
MAKLYDLNQSIIDTIEYGVDVESGEILDQEELNKKLEELQIALNDKLEGIALYSKQLTYDINDFDTEIDNLKARKKAMENKKTGLDNFLSTYLLNNGYEKGFSTSKVKVGFRKSTQVNITGEVPKEFIKVKTTESIDKQGIKDLLKSTSLPYAELVENKNMNIK